MSQVPRGHGCLIVTLIMLGFWVLLVGAIYGGFALWRCLK